MSAPTPAPGDDSPREGYYPDPSIPGYVRYWNGSSWVPGTSRPAPSGGEPLAAPGAAPASSPAPGASPAPASSPALAQPQVQPQPQAPTPVPAPASVEETGPHFFDEDPQQYGGRPEPASAWGADRSRQSGFGGDQDRRVSWGGPQPGPLTPDPRTAPPDAAPDSTFMSRRPTVGPAAADEGTMIFRTPSPRAPEQAGAGPQGPVGVGGASGSATGEPGAGVFGPPGSGGPGDPGPGPGPGFGAAGPAAAGAPGAPAAPGKPGFGAGKAAADRAAAAQAVPARSAPVPTPQAVPARSAPVPTPQAVPARSAPVPQPAPAPVPQAAPAQGALPLSGTPGAPGLPGQADGPPAAGPGVGGAPMAVGPGGGQQSWAQQVHRLAGAGDDQPVVPWKPPVDDVFQAAARRQAAARPAGLGRRLGARLVDTLVLAAVTGTAAVPLGLKAVEHVNDKIDAAELTGETVTVWLLDGTTSVYLGVVLAVLICFGVVYEALPTARWGRTLGKKLFGLQVRDIEGHEPPSFGLALRRWLVYSVPGLLAVGIIGIVWGLFDRPWRQCWHDKAAHTFVAG
ncbi:RDD family protein [Streptomyces sp. NPDC014882]|uniref:RDD family protein n=1 Tax=Streptomyces sp. NPDC014882 TaxID=3364927 RepID=UPI0036F5530C